MMERHLQTEQHWERWLDLLARHPGAEAELDARASLLVERHLEDLRLEQAVVLAIERTDVVHEALDEQERRAARAKPGGWRWWQAAGVAAALAAGVLLGLVVPDGPVEPDLTWRGDSAVHALPVMGWGTVQVEQDRHSLGRMAVGRGLRPTLQVQPGPLVVRWNIPEPPEGFDSWAWLADAQGRVVEGPVLLDERAEFSSAEGARALVVAFGPDDVDPEALAASIGGGRQMVGPLGPVQVVGFDLEQAR